MKTDRFTEIIRRKLESIRPEFTEKDWQRMQATLQQAGPPQPDVSGGGHSTLGHTWMSQPWLAAAAAVSTVALITLSVWQRREITHLRETLAQVEQKKSAASNQADVTSQRAEPVRPNVANTDATRPEQTAGSSSPVAQSNETVRRDTVYITRYLPAPSRIDVESRPRVIQRDLVPTERYATSAKPNPSTVDGELVPNNTIPNQKTELNDKLSTRNSSNRSVPNQPLTTGNDLNSVATRPSRQQDRTAYVPPTVNSGSTSPVVPDASPTAPSVGSSSSRGSSPEAVATNAITANYELATSRPLSLDKIDWNTALAHRARRLRIWRPSSAPTVMEPTMSKPVEHLTFKLRVGPTTDVSSHMWNIGGAAEMLVSDKFTLSAGLTRSTYLIGTFLTAEDFDVRTHRDFRGQFAKGIDPRSDILNIETRMVRVQLPISIGYRIPISQSFTIFPTIGTNLNLNNIETLTFYYRMPLRGLNQQIPSGVGRLTYLQTLTLAQASNGIVVIGQVRQAPRLPSHFHRTGLFLSKRLGLD